MNDSSCLKTFPNSLPCKLFGHLPLHIVTESPSYWCLLLWIIIYSTCPETKSEELPKRHPPVTSSCNLSLWPPLSPSPKTSPWDFPLQPPLETFPWNLPWWHTSLDYSKELSRGPLRKPHQKSFSENLRKNSSKNLLRRPPPKTLLNRFHSHFCVMFIGKQT